MLLDEVEKSLFVFVGWSVQSGNQSIMEGLGLLVIYIKSIEDPS